MVPKMISMRQPQSRPQTFSATTGPPDGDARQQRPSEQDSVQLSDKTKRRTIYSRLDRLTDGGSLCTTASLFSTIISIISSTFRFGNARRSCNARSCSSNSRTYPRDHLARSRTVPRALRLKTKHADRFSLIKDSTVSASYSGRECTRCTERSVPAVHVTPNSVG